MDLEEAINLMTDLRGRLFLPPSCTDIRLRIYLTVLSIKELVLCPSVWRFFQRGGKKKTWLKELKHSRDYHLFSVHSCCFSKADFLLIE